MLHFFDLSFRWQLFIILAGGWGLAYLLTLAVQWHERRRTQRILALDDRINRGMRQLARDPDFRARADAWTAAARRPGVFPKPVLRPDEAAMRGRLGKKGRL